MVNLDNMNCFRQKTIGFLNFLNAFLVKKKNVDCWSILLYTT